MNSFTKYFSMLFAVILWSTSCQKPSPSHSNKAKEIISGRQPNVIIIFTDDQGYADLSSYGATNYNTPQIDSLAASGIRLTDFYVAATVCTPSRAALLTGSYPKRVGLHEYVLRPFSETGLSPDEYTIAEMLKDAGYSTACVGKWHLGHQAKFMPNNQGFDYYFGVPYSNDMDSYYYARVDFQSPPLPLYENQSLIEEGPEQSQLTQRFTDKAIEYIEAHKAEPFFLYLAHVMPHIPLHASEDFKGKTDYGLYGDVITEIDWNVGRIVSYLKQEGLFDNTIIIYTSDNGPHRAENEGSAQPLRGWKTQTWEGGQRVPCIISWPEQIPANSVSSEVVSSMDLMPTLASIVGGALPKDRKIDGRDIKDFLLNPEQKLEAFPLFYYANNGQVEAVRLGKWKLHIAKRGFNNGADFPLALYDLESDIGEQLNIADQYPEVVQELKTLITQFDQQLTEEARPVGRL